MLEINKRYTRRRNGNYLHNSVILHIARKAFCIVRLPGHHPLEYIGQNWFFMWYNVKLISDNKMKIFSNTFFLSKFTTNLDIKFSQEYTQHIWHLPVFGAFKSDSLFHNIINELRKGRDLNKSYWWSIDPPNILTFFL